jgi:rhodanese-related sulfurtransferase
LRALTKLGYTNVKEYAGGKKDWMKARLPVDSAPRDLKEAIRYIFGD